MHQEGMDRFIMYLKSLGRQGMHQRRAPRLSYPLSQIWGRNSKNEGRSITAESGNHFFFRVLKEAHVKTIFHQNLVLCACVRVCVRVCVCACVCVPAN